MNINYANDVPEGKTLGTETLVSGWTEHIRKSRRYQKTRSTSRSWPDYRKMYRGIWPQGVTPINRIFSFGRAMLPQVYFQNPRVVVTPTRPEMWMHARVVEAVDNWIIKEINLKQTLKQAALHAYLAGIGPIKLGFDSQYGYIPDQSVLPDGATMTQVSRRELRNIEYATQVKAGMPWALPTLPEDVIFPAGYAMRDTMPWVGHIIRRPLEDVKRDQKYKNNSKLQGTMVSDFDANASVFATEHTSEIWAELVEIRDWASQKLYVLCEGNLLMAVDDPLQVEALPWDYIVFNEDPEYPWGISDVEVLMPQQDELNETRTQASAHRRIALLKFLYLKGAIKENQLNEFLSGKVGPAIEVEAEAIAQAITVLQPHVPMDFRQEMDQIMRDMRETVAMSENQVGSFAAATGRSATEVGKVAQSFDNRTGDRRSVMTDVVERVIRQFNQMIFRFWKEPRVIEILGPMAKNQWVTYTGDELAGEYNLRIDIDSGFPINTQVRLSAADALMKQYGGDPMVDSVMLKKLHLQQYESLFPGISQIVKEAIPQPQADAMDAERQPHPIGSGSGSGTRQVGPQGMHNTGSTHLPARGGGRVSNVQKEAPISIEQARQQMKGA